MECNNPIKKLDRRISSVPRKSSKLYVIIDIHCHFLNQELSFLEKFVFNSCFLVSNINWAPRYMIEKLSLFLSKNDNSFISKVPKNLSR